jgi:hypothetical protein
MAQFLAEAFIIFVDTITLERVVWSTCLLVNISHMAALRIKLMASLCLMLRSELLKLAIIFCSLKIHQSNTFYWPVCQLV